MAKASVRTIATLAAVAAVAATTALADELARGYVFQSRAGSDVAWIPSYATDYPDIAAAAPEIPAELLAMTVEPARMQYTPATLDDMPEPLGYRFLSPAGPEVAWVPSVESDPAMPLWLSSAALAQEAQVGAVPQGTPSDTAR